jgi:hypothetical protein
MRIGNIIFITLTDASGVVVVNANHVVRISKNPEGGSVIFLTSGSLSVQESLEEIRQNLKPEGGWR